MMEFLSLIPNLFIVQFFRRIRSRRQRPSSLRQALYQLNVPIITFVFHTNGNFICFCHISRKDASSSVPKKKLSKITFPWWCLFIAYALSFSLMAVSIFFIIARGIEYGDLKTQKWLTSILTGFFSSIFLTEPIKVLLSCSGLHRSTVALCR